MEAYTMKTLVKRRASHSGPISWVFVALFLMAVSPPLTMADDVDKTLQQAEQRFQYNALFNPLTASSERKSAVA
jgi:hypothetical protein